MKVLIVSSNVGRSSSEIMYSFVFDEIFRLAKRGIEVHAGRLKFEGSGFSYGIHFHDIDKKFKLQALLLGFRSLSSYPLISLIRSPKVIYGEFLYGYHVSNILKKIKPDLIHAHFAWPEGWVSYLAKKYLKQEIALVVTLHGYDILVERSVNYGIRLRKQYDFLVKRVLDEAKAIIVASKAVYEECNKLCNKSKIYLIPNGVDIKRFTPELDASKFREKLGIQDELVVFTVRHHQPKYGIEYLLRAAPSVLEEYKDVIFIIGGDGPLKKYHEELALKLKIRDKTIFTGHISQSELPYYYALSSIVVVPSLQEAWGLVVTEAMASGKPVIGSDVGGIKDQIINGYNGFLVPPRAPEALADKILYFLKNQDEIKRMGRNGRKLAEEKFDIEKRIDVIVSLYEEIKSSEK